MSRIDDSRIHAVYAFSDDRLPTPFHCVDCFVAWQEKNCCRCVRYEPDVDRLPTCDLQLAVETCCLSDSAALLVRLHLGANAGPCHALELTDEAKRRNSFLATRPLFGGR